MRRIETDLELIPDIATIKGKRIIDVGCGNGELMRALAAKGANATGIDCKEVLEKALKFPVTANESYLEGGGEKLPIENNSADLIIYFASFHHIPETAMDEAINEIDRVLKPGGTALLLEPVTQDGSYTELIRLVEDEQDIQKLADEAIKRASKKNLTGLSEEIVYFERSLRDYMELLEKYVPEQDRRERLIAEAEKITGEMCKQDGVKLEAFRYKSICRLHVLRNRR